MNSPLSRWVQMRAGKEVHPNETQKSYLGLSKMANMLAIPDCDTLIAHHHDAGADAHITCMIYVTVLKAVDTESGSGALGGQFGQHEVVMKAAPTITDMPDDMPDDEMADVTNI